ncbi:MAG TPA: hypothetical protein VF028_08600 [Actinomycetota bacterium]|nr:hypothetical protein [Actinomycetota bacterium]
MHDRRERTMDGLTMAGSPSPQRVRWGAVFAGVVLGLALLALLTTLWFALAYNSGVDVVRDNLEWFIGGTAVAALFIGGLLAGWLSGVRGPGSGFFNGITMWGLILIVAVAVGLPAVFNILNLGPVASIDEGGLIGTGVDDTLWATFFTILGGFLASGLGGLIGGAVTMPANAHLQRTDIVDEDHDHVDVRDHDDDHDHDHDDDEDERETVTTRRAS